jgi:hypothetical protein
MPLQDAQVGDVLPHIGHDRARPAAEEYAREALDSRRMTAGQPPTTDAIRGLIRRLLEVSPFSGREQLLAQVEGVEYIDGPLTMMDLRVVGLCPSATGVPSPVPSSPTVVGNHGEPIGSLVLWLDAQGYINCLEYGYSV